MKAKLVKESLDSFLAENPKYYTTLVQAGLVDEEEALDLYRKLLA